MKAIAFPRLKLTGPGPLSGDKSFRDVGSLATTIENMFALVSAGNQSVLRGRLSTRDVDGGQKHVMEPVRREHGFGKLSAPLVSLELAALVAGFIAARRMYGPRRVPHLRAWQRLLAEQHGKITAAILAAQVQTHYEELYFSRPRFASRALRWHLERQLLPGLALYRVLQQEMRDRQDALDETERILGATFTEVSDLIPLLNRMPNSFTVLRKVAHLVMDIAFPPEGWDIEMVGDDEKALAFNIHNCFYVNMLNRYGAPELTAVFCKLDDVAYAKLPPSIKWERTRTLGRGDEQCDFRWSKIDLVSSSKFQVSSCE